MNLDLTLTHDFIKGAIAMGLLVGAAFFLRFWRETHDRLFIYFAIALLFMAVNRPLDTNNTIVPYVIRLCTYVIIILGIVDKNLRRT